MKNFLFAFAAGCIPALAVTNGTYAQSSNNIDASGAQENVAKLDNSRNHVKDNTANITTINTRAAKDFKKSYKAAGGEKWAKTDEGFTASFTSDGVSNTIFYNKKGQWIASLKNYGENKLPHDIRGMVKRSYYDYKINCVQEIETSETYGKPTYIVHLEDSTGIKLVRVNDDQMDVYEEFRKP